MSPPSPASSTGHRAALIAMAAGVCAALHVGKLAPAIPALRDALGLSLVQAGFLLSLVQAAGMTLGVTFGVVADGLGARRSMLLGLAVLALASAAGGAATGVGALLALRAVEGFGFLLVVLPAPGLVRALVAPQQVHRMMGLWGAYMPLATALALLLGPLCIAALGWRAWWWLLAALSVAMAWVFAAVVPRDGPAGTRNRSDAAAAPVGMAWLQRLRLTLAAPGPWWVALTFAMYSGQWLAVIGFLPAIATQAGAPAAAIGPLTALAAAANMVGNIASGRLLQRGVPASRLLATGFIVMALGAAATFAGGTGSTGGTDAGGGPPAALRYAAVLLFSGVGGLIPGTLFSLAVRVAPGAHTLSTTVGWVQQWSSLGQFAGPPLVAWVASQAGGWQYTGWVTGACSLAGLALVPLLMRQLPR
jgi:MFS family permease